MSNSVPFKTVNTYSIITDGKQIVAQPAQTYISQWKKGIGKSKFYKSQTLVFRFIHPLLSDSMISSLQLTSTLPLTCYVAVLWPELWFQFLSNHCIRGCSWVVRQNTYKINQLDPLPHLTHFRFLLLVLYCNDNFWPPEEQWYWYRQLILHVQ